MWYHGQARFHSPECSSPCYLGLGPTLARFPHLNVPIHFTVKGICHMKGPRFVSGVREVTEVMDSDDHRFVPLADVLRL